MTLPGPSVPGLLKLAGEQEEPGSDSPGSDGPENVIPQQNRPNLRLILEEYAIMF